MARKRLHEEHENHERWLVSYADFITLLFAFFVVMYAISSINEGKYRVLSDALVSAFRQPQRSVRPIQVGDPAKSPVSSDVEFMNQPVAIQTPHMTVPQQRPLGNHDNSQHGGAAGRGAEDIEKIASEVSAAMAPLVEQGLVSVQRNDLWVEVEIKDSVLFSSGSARLQDQAVPVLKKIAAILSDFPNPIRVEGYTDNLPIDTLLYPSNWELSTARAASVVRLLDGLGIEPRRLSALGYGEHRPLVDNGTPEGRAKNRRVTLVVLADQQAERLLDERLPAQRRSPPRAAETARPDARAAAPSAPQPAAAAEAQAKLPAGKPAAKAAASPGTDTAGSSPAPAPARADAAAHVVPEFEPVPAAGAADAPVAPPIEVPAPFLQPPIKFAPPLPVGAARPAPAPALVPPATAAAPLPEPSAVATPAADQARDRIPQAQAAVAAPRPESEPEPVFPDVESGARVAGAAPISAPLIGPRVSLAPPIELPVTPSLSDGGQRP